MRGGETPASLTRHIMSFQYVKQYVQEIRHETALHGRLDEAWRHLVEAEVALQDAMDLAHEELRELMEYEFDKWC